MKEVMIMVSFLHKKSNWNLWIRKVRYFRNKFL